MTTPTKKVWVLKPIKRTNTFNGFRLQFFHGTAENKQPMPLRGYQVRCHFKLGNSADVAFGFDTADGTIEFVDDLAGKVKFLPLKINAKAGDYNADVKLVDPSGYEKTYMNISLKVKQNITD